MRTKTYEPVRFDSIRQMLTMAVNEAGEKCAFRFKIKGGSVRDVTFSEFYNDTQSLGAALCSLGLGSAHIACIASNSYKWIQSFFSVLQGAGVFVPVDKELAEEDILRILSDSDAQAVFYEERFDEFFRKNADNLPGIKYFIGFDSKIDDDRFISYDALFEKGKEISPSEYNTLKSLPDDLKLLVYTSGTTGKSKGVMLTEHNLVSAVYYALRVSQPSEVGLSVLPYYHTYEAVCDLLVSVHYHSTLCINESIKYVSRNLKLYKPQYIFLVPMFTEFFYSGIVHAIKKKDMEAKVTRAIKFSNFLRKFRIDIRHYLFKDILEEFGGRLECMVCGGAPIRPEIGKFFDCIGITLLGGYGITECSPLVCMNNRANPTFDSAGRLLDCIECKIEDKDADGVGEICVRGDVVMKGYYKEPEKTAESLRGGWFHTGDLGKITEDKRIIICGRKKNLIVLNNGKNIFPEEIEGYIQKINGVSEVIVYALKNEYGEETELVAEIYPDDGANPEEIEAEIKKVMNPLPYYKRISKVVIRNTPFLKTATQKIKRA